MIHKKKLLAIKKNQKGWCQNPKHQYTLERKCKKTVDKIGTFLVCTYM